MTAGGPITGEAAEPGPDVEPRRRRVLVSAYHAAPGQGPEASAGWAFAMAAARDNDVWLITRPRFSPIISRILAAQPDLASRMHVTYLDLPDFLTRHKKRPWDLYWYYVGWQRALARRARQLHDELPFDVAHHVTFANDWLPAGVTQLPEVPVVWGPVGGGTALPLFRLGRWLGTRGAATEVARLVGTWLPRRLWGNGAARRASLVVAQNPEVAQRFSFARAVVTEPNAAFTSTDHPVTRSDARGFHKNQRVAVFAGRLIGLKGVRLAIDTIAHPDSADWRLDIYGDGYDRLALERRAAKLGVEDRVRFLGHRRREELLGALAEADACLFPSLHDQAGWVAGEASSLGCPVVCLPLGGPPILAHTNAFVASLKGDIITNLAVALKQAGAARCVPHDRWSVDRLPDLVNRWYELAVSEQVEAIHDDR